MNTRNPLLIANWKMQLTVQQTVQLITELRREVRHYRGPVQLVACPSFTSLPEAHRRLVGSKIRLGAQDVFWDDRGPYTGAISPLMLRELGVEYVIVGHSERRHHLGETDDMVARKMVSALAHGLQPILCVGESTAERSQGVRETVVRRQLTEAFRSLPPPSQGRRIAVVYEPIWAIGTGMPADPDQATEMRNIIHQTLIDLYAPTLVDRQFLILYGGSVDPQNICDYIRGERFDGALVGTASLNAQTFVTMLKEVSDCLS
ncbi:MAG: triose-phosphate isomerase [Candidatus Kerfeldbacteria bacterium]|nr:triose-phosphate isomerase [Candidatus Kerfeldbacteria bacterium]